MSMEMRIKDRQLSKDEAIKILQNGKYGVLSCAGADDYPYGVPLHYVIIDGEAYFHSSAKDGHKTDCFARNGIIAYRLKTEHISAKFLYKPDRQR